MAGLEDELINGIRSLPPQEVAALDRWIDSDPAAVQILIRAVPSLGPMFEPFVNGNGAPTGQQAQPRMQQPPAGMQSAQMLSKIAGR